MWLIDGNKLKEKAVSLLFPTKMEECGHLPEPVQAVVVAEIEGMLYREGVEVVLCKDCKHREEYECPMYYEEKIEWDDDGYTEIEYVPHDRTDDDGFCDKGERREGE